MPLRLSPTAGRILAILAGVLLPVTASAFGPLYVVCRGLAGCGTAPGNAIAAAIITTLAVLITVAAGASVIFVVYSGFQMVISFGDESKITEGKWGVLYALGGLGIALAAGSIVQFIGTQYFGQGSGDVVLSFMTSVVTIIVVLFNVFFGITVVVAGLRMVIGGGKSDEFKNGFNMIKAAVIGAVIINAGRALVNAFLSINF